MAELHSIIRPVIAVSVAIWKEDSLLLVQRGHEPFAGSWSFPGGKVRPGEKLEEAARREVDEETSLQTGPLQYVCPVEIIRKSGGVLNHHIVVSFFTGYWKTGEAVPASDVRQVRWAGLSELGKLQTTENLKKYAEAARKLLEAAP